MIQSNPSDERNGAAPNTHDLRQVFVVRVHQVLQEGYRRLDAPSLQATAEPAITGELVRSMQGFLRSMDAPDWADHFSVHDDPPVNEVGRQGKERRRIDIRVDAATPRPGAGFAFEAKRLARGYTVSKYLGDDGLGCFLCGAYARQDDDAGMLGYVQDDDEAYWAKEIEDAMRKDEVSHEISGTNWWETHEFPNGPKHVFVSRHRRPAVGRPIAVYHSLLLFRQTTE